MQLPASEPTPPTDVEPSKEPEYNISTPYVVNDTTLWFELDNEVITKDTNRLTGTREMCPGLFFEVYVNDNKITEYKCNSSLFYKYFDFPVDLSEYKAGDELKLVMGFIGKKKSEDIKIYNDPCVKTYTIQ